MDSPALRALTNRVRLRDVTEADIPILFEQQCDPEANQMAAFPARDWPAFAAHWTRILGDATITTQTILFDGQVAGNIGSWEQDGQREVGYWLGGRYWGQGVATQALSAFLRLLQVRPLYAYVAQHNVASRRVLEKCGFIVCGEGTGPALGGGEAVKEYVLILRGDESKAAP